MALKGWRLKSISLGWILKYERMEPKRLYYAVHVSGRCKGSEENAQMDLFTQLHWNYVCGNGFFTVYVSEVEDAGANRIGNPWSRAPVYLGVLYFLFLVYTGLAFWITKQYYLKITANTYFLLIPAVAAALFVKAAAGTVYYGLWRKRKKKQLPVPTKPLNIHIKNFVSLIPFCIVAASAIFCVVDAEANADYINLKFYSIFILLGFLLLYFALLSVRSIFKHEISFKAIVLLVITALISVYEVYAADYYAYKDEYSGYEIVIEEKYYAKLYRDKLPLTMSDFGYTPGNYYGSTYLGHRNALVSYEKYEDYSVNHLWERQKKTVCYEVFASRADCLIDAYLNWELRICQNFTRTDNPAWGASAVYEEKQYPYRKVAVYDGKVIVVHYFEKINQPLIDVIKEKLLSN